MRRCNRYPPEVQVPLHQVRVECQAERVLQQGDVGLIDGLAGIACKRRVGRK